MKLKAIALATSLIALSAYAAEESKTDLTTQQQMVSYSIGVDLGRNMAKQKLDLDMNALSMGLKNGFLNQPLKLSDEKMKEVLMNFQKDFIAKRNSEMMKKSQDNLKEGQAFLEANKKKQGVITTASGLQYKVITMGKGAKPTAEDNVTVEYKGSLIDGNVFDSSEKAGHPVSFKVNQVIKGWTEILPMMPVGSTFEVYIPADLAYGQQAVGSMIGPNETLIFNIHLVSIDKKS
jgi:FKBP-type peptidyl-prolyl cis-trans isomerase FklB